MTIIYDDIGNPVLVGEDAYVWEGRKLLSLYDDYEFSNYTYNTDGIRTSKEYGEYDYNGYLHKYTLNDSQIVKEVVYYDDDGSGTYEESYTLIYIYDEMGAPIGMKHRTPSYAVGVYDYFFFEKNLQGDIIGIYNSSGMKILSYTYDAWGKFTETYVDGGPTDISIARKNPFRYRGYYYDNNSGLYYLQSRYYNPTWGRFINADATTVLIITPDQLTDKNLYAYCDNNPVMRIDADGDFWGAITGAIIGAVFGGIEAALNGDNVWAAVGIGALAGAVSGLAVDLSIATGGLAGVAIAAAGGALASIAEDTLNNKVNGRENNWGEIFYSAACSAVTNALSFGMGLEDGIKTGAKTIKQAFQYVGQNFVKSTIANGAGKISKYAWPRIRNCIKNSFSELVNSFAFDFTTDIFEEAMWRFFGGK